MSTSYNLVAVWIVSSCVLVQGLKYVRTMDKKPTLEDELPYVQGMLSNHPGIVSQVLQQNGIRLATQSSSIPPVDADSRDVITNVTGVGCDCEYHPGGCSISKPAPSGMACFCRYKGAWTCGGHDVQCLNQSSYYCAHPDNSVFSCLLGGGNCGAYKTATCDCDYHYGGCTISKAPPPNTACYCSYKEFLTCSGSITECNDFNNYYCKNPDYSINTCKVGGGDCDGY